MAISTKNNKATRPTFFGRFNGLTLWKKAVIVVVFLALIWFFSVQIFAQKSTTSQYETATAQQGTIISTVDESGNVNASSQTQVTSPSNGLIQQVFVKNGQYVQAGQKLFSVKSTATPQEKASAYASYENALASYQSATQSKQAMEATLEKDRNAILSDQDTLNNFNGNPNVVNPQTKQPYTQNEKDELNSAVTTDQETFAADQTKYNQEDTQIAAANAQLNSASLSYQATQNSTVTAPISGTVANVSVQPGAAVTASTVTTTSNSTSFGSSSSSSSSGGSAVMSIGNYGQLSILAQVNEVDIPKIKVGQNATVTLDAFPDATYVGTVESVDSVGTISSGVVTYNVYINLVSPPSSIKAGMSASVAIQTARADDVVTVPSAAVQTSNGTSYVRVLKNGKVSTVAVTTGISDNTNIEIKSGISVGDVVITGTNATTTSSSTTSPFSSGLGGNRGFGGGGGFGGGTTRTGGGAAAGGAR
ncbi:MAG TPA: HlyD family efflux transporter periplasmic adaptor subunit [Candidatus Saccharimonadales bacterium]|nr:HlyD family efflux transporter periplasmic adaptor subunit [Candidatus Saccharimonadales bacterium]